MHVFGVPYTQHHLKPSVPRKGPALGNAKRARRLPRNALCDSRSTRLLRGSRGVTGALCVDLIPVRCVLRVRMALRTVATARGRTPPAARAGPAGPVKNIAFDELKVAQLRRVFTLLDTDGDGFLSDEELRSAVEAAGIVPTWAILADARGEGAAGAALESVRRRRRAWAAAAAALNCARRGQYLHAVETHFVKDPLSMEAFVQLFALFERGGHDRCVLACSGLALRRARRSAAAAVGSALCPRSTCGTYWPVWRHSMG